MIFPVQICVIIAHFRPLSCAKIKIPNCFVVNRIQRYVVYSCIFFIIFGGKCIFVLKSQES